MIIYGDSITHGYDASEPSRSYANRIALSLDAHALNADSKAFLAQQALLMPYAKDTLKALKEYGYRLFIITNGDKTVQKSRLEKSPILPFFEKVFI